MDEKVELVGFVCDICKKEITLAELPLKKGPNEEYSFRDWTIEHICYECQCEVADHISKLILRNKMTQKGLELIKESIMEASDETVTE